MNARDVVKLAASRSDSAREWLERDEFGSWERQAQEMIDSTAERRERESISDERVADEMANVLCLRAVRALLEEVRAKKAVRRG